MSRAITVERDADEKPVAVTVHLRYWRRTVRVGDVLYGTASADAHRQLVVRGFSDSGRETRVSRSSVTSHGTLKTASLVGRYAPRGGWRRP